jgi:hypothetical protein
LGARSLPLSAASLDQSQYTRNYGGTCCDDSQDAREVRGAPPCFSMVALVLARGTARAHKQFLFGTQRPHSGQASLDDSKLRRSKR